MTPVSRVAPRGVPSSWGPREREAAAPGWRAENAVVVPLACLFDDDRDRGVFGLLRLGQLDMQKTIVELCPNAARINRAGDDDTPLKLTVIDFHLAKRAPPLAARVFPMSAHQQHAVVQRD